MKAYFMDPAKVNEYVRLYKLAVIAVSDESLLPARSDNEIKELISHAGWLGLREKGEEKEDFTNSPKPNVWVDINEMDKENRYPDALDEDLNGTGLRIGLYFNTIAAMRNAKNLLESHNDTQKEELLGALSRLEDLYYTRLRRKIKSYNYAQTPAYETVLKFRTNQIDNEKISELFKKSEEIEADGKAKMKLGQVVQEFPSLDLVYVKLSNDDAEFSSRIKEVFGIYKIVRNIKSKKAYDKEKAEMRLERDRAYAEEFSKQIENLDNMKLSPEEWRKRRDEWQKDHPRPF